MRDLAIVLVSAGLWWWLADVSSGSGALADLTGLVVGLGLGACAYLFHEWGHIAGAAVSGGVIRPGTGLRSPSNFTFDTNQSTRAQFLSMSFGGFLATGVFLWAYYVLLPDEQLSTRVARGAIAFLTLLGVTLELPLVLYSLATGKLPPLERPERGPSAPSAVPPAAEAEQPS